MFAKQNGHKRWRGKRCVNCRYCRSSRFTCYVLSFSGGAWFFTHSLPIMLVVGIASFWRWF